MSVKRFALIIPLVFYVISGAHASDANVKLVSDSLCGTSGMNTYRLEIMINNGVLGRSELESILPTAMQDCLVSPELLINPDGAAFVTKYLPMDAKVPWAIVGTLYDARTKNPKMYTAASDMLSKVVLLGPMRPVKLSKLLQKVRRSPKDAASKVSERLASSTNCWGDSIPYLIIRTGDWEAIKIAIERGLIAPDTRFPYTPGIPKHIPIYDSYIEVTNASLSEYRIGDHLLMAKSRTECPWIEMQRNGLTMTLAEMLIEHIRSDRSVSELLTFVLKRGFKVAPSTFHSLVIPYRGPRLGMGLSKDGFAITIERESLFDDLIEAGADINYAQNGKTILRRAIDGQEFNWPNGRLIDALTKRGARLN
ncbi:hypothetical protein BJ122_11764 [Rhodopseudomonas faecalis]|uniref:Ankyrin repeat protein n=1 Tax=Rhodopseudomonas faecalis TaxID=99655 RepID=A0A318TA53_9BRAD|nr:hypothetical protein [Rhodopseudomonas faecalis]PYF01841.1 hypothetical protein BJ122_11764 [Rhodopseudomonas faecalis]